MIKNNSSVLLLFLHYLWPFFSFIITAKTVFIIFFIRVRLCLIFIRVCLLFFLLECISGYCFASIGLLYGSLEAISTNFLPFKSNHSTDQTFQPNFCFEKLRLKRCMVCRQSLKLVELNFPMGESFSYCLFWAIMNRVKKMNRH